MFCEIDFLMKMMLFAVKILAKNATLITLGNGIKDEKERFLLIKTLPILIYEGLFCKAVEIGFIPAGLNFMTKMMLPNHSQDRNHFVFTVGAIVSMKPFLLMANLTDINQRPVFIYRCRFILRHKSNPMIVLSNIVILP